MLPVNPSPRTRCAPFVLLLAAVLAGGCAGERGEAAAATAEAAAPIGPELHRQLFEAGEDFDSYLAGVQRRVELWRELAALQPDAAAVQRAHAASEGRGWMLLVVADDGCSDSASTIPYVARLLEAAGTVELRVVDGVAGRPVMQAHPTPDGRAATPTLLLLDEHFTEIGCWIERPAALQAWALGAGASLSDREFGDQKAGWYRGDRGRDTVAGIVEMLEAAAAGSPRC
jgi:hypothetical protein